MIRRSSANGWIRSTWECLKPIRLGPHIDPAILADEERKIAEKAYGSYQKFVAEGLQPAIDALRAPNTQLAMEIMQGPMRQNFVDVEQGIAQLIKIQLDVAKADFISAQELYIWVRNSCVTAIALGVLFAIGIGIWLTRAISMPLNKAVLIARSVAAGDLTQKIEVRSGDETGQLLQALKHMNDSLIQTVGQVRRSTETIGVASARDRERERGPVIAHRVAGEFAGRDGLVDGRADVDGEAECGECAAGESTGGLGLGLCGQGRASGGASGGHHGLDQGKLEKDRRHHRRDRRHRVPDQHSGAERGGGSGACRRAGARLCGGGGGSAQPGATLGGGGQGNQGTDRRLGGKGGRRQQAGGRSGQDDGARS